MSDLVVYAPPSTEEWQQLTRTATAIAKTDFVPKAVRNNDGAVLACLLTGRELGIGPMQALREVYVIEGKPTMSAQLMVSLVRRAGHRIRCVESTDRRAVFHGWRVGEFDLEPVEVVFTIEDAQRAKLTGKDVWQKYPKAMLWARGASQLCRQEFSEVLCGVKYTAEEARSIGDGDGPPSTHVSWGEAEVVEQAPGPREASGDRGGKPVGVPPAGRGTASEAEPVGGTGEVSDGSSAGGSQDRGDSPPASPGWFSDLCWTLGVDPGATVDHLAGEQLLRSYLKGIDQAGRLAKLEAASGHMKRQATNMVEAWAAERQAAESAEQLA